MVGFEIEDEDEVAEEIHMNEYDLRSKGAPSASKYQSTLALATKNRNESKPSTTSDALNIGYNIAYDMQKTWANILLYEISKLT